MNWVNILGLLIVVFIFLIAVVLPITLLYLYIKTKRIVKNVPEEMKGGNKENAKEEDRAGRGYGGGLGGRGGGGYGRGGRGRGRRTSSQKEKVEEVSRKFRKGNSQSRESGAEIKTYFGKYSGVPLPPSNLPKRNLRKPKKNWEQFD